MNDVATPALGMPALLNRERAILEFNRRVLAQARRPDVPLLERLRRDYPHVHWRGVVPRPELVRIYSAADAFVFPSHSETFGQPATKGFLMRYILRKKIRPYEPA